MKVPLAIAEDSPVKESTSSGEKECVIALSMESESWSRPSIENGIASTRSMARKHSTHVEWNCGDLRILKNRFNMRK